MTQEQHKVRQNWKDVYLAIFANGDFRDRPSMLGDNRCVGPAGVALLSF